MVVSGAFASHTTKLYNYYVCPINYNTDKLKYIAVSYFGELKYIGEIISGPSRWEFLKERITIIENANEVPQEVRNDLEQFKCKLDEGEHNLFLLKPIMNCCESQYLYSGTGAFTRGHRYFETLDLMFTAFSSGQEE